MDVAAELRRARTAAGLTQRALAARAGTSQSAIAAYEAGRKDPSASTLARLLGAAGAELTVARRDPRPIGDRLVEVLRLAEALPVRHERELRFPRVPVPGHR